MAVEYVGAGTVVNGSVSSPPTPPWPTSHAAGDIGILLVETPNYTVSAPSGWTEIAQYGVGTAGASGSSRLAAFYKFAASGSESAPTVSIDSGFANAVIVGLRGVDSTTPIISYNGQANFAFGTTATKSIPATSSGSVTTIFLAAMAVSGNYTGSGQAFSGFTTRVNGLHFLAGTIEDSGSRGATTTAVTVQSNLTYSGIIMAFTPGTPTSSNFFMFF